MTETKHYGKTISGAKINNEELALTFAEGGRLTIYDGGQSCCEYRHMSTDDDVQSLVGHKLMRIEAKDGPETEGDYDVHETCFVEVGTDQNFITLVNHNEHNGYYGGFYIKTIDG